MTHRARGWRAGVAALLVIPVIAVTAVGAARARLWPPADAAFASGPVVVLGGGGGERLALGQRVLAGDERELVVTGDAVDAWLRQGRSCEEPGVACVLPEPWNTAGEARAVAALAAVAGWDRVTVVTSDFHAPRVRMLMDRCLDVPVAVLAAGTDPPVPTRAWRWTREALATSRDLVMDPCR